MYTDLETTTHVYSILLQITDLFSTRLSAALSSYVSLRQRSLVLASSSYRSKSQ